MDGDVLETSVENMEIETVIDELDDKSPNICYIKDVENIVSDTAGGQEDARSKPKTDNSDDNPNKLNKNVPERTETKGELDSTGSQGDSGSTMIVPERTGINGGSGSIIPSIGIVVLVAVFGVLVACFCFDYSVTSPSHNYNSIVTFTDKLKKMQKDFPNQNEVFWNMLRNSGHRHLKKVHDGDKEKHTPLSYLVAGYAGSSKTVDCFVSRLNDAYISDYVRILDSQDFIGENDKGKLVNEITLRLNGMKKLLVVKDIDKLPFKVAQLFMSYADEHNKVALYPQSVLILTTELPFSYDPARSRHLDEGNVGKHFKTNVWHGVHPNKAAPLWSRVGDRLVLIRKEENYPCNE